MLESRESQQRAKRAGDGKRPRRNDNGLAYHMADQYAGWEGTVQLR